MKYRSKPKIIEAVQFTGDDSVKKMREAWGVDFERNVSTIGDGDYAYVQSLEGEVYARKTDYIVRGIKGEFYPVREDIFLESYEKVEERCKHDVLLLDRCFQCDPNIGVENRVEE